MPRFLLQCSVYFRKNVRVEIVLCPLFPSDGQHELGGVDARSRWRWGVRRGKQFEADASLGARRGGQVLFLL